MSTISVNNKTRNIIDPRSVVLGLMATLALLFVYLKVMGFVDWSWVWVLGPIWILPVAVVALTTAGLILATVVMFAAVIVVAWLEDDREEQSSD